MRRVKELGRGTYMFYEKELNARMQARRRAETELREAVAGEQFELYFQPIIDLDALRDRAVPRRSFAGIIPSAAWSRRRSSFRSPKSAASSTSLVPG